MAGVSVVRQLHGQVVVLHSATQAGNFHSTLHGVVGQSETVKGHNVAGLHIVENSVVQFDVHGAVQVALASYSTSKVLS